MVLLEFNSHGIQYTFRICPSEIKVRAEMSALYDEGAKLAVSFQKDKKKEGDFHYAYQRWYTKALKVVTSLAPDRIAEFRGFYEADPKEKC